MSEERTGFLGTYFDRDQVMRLSKVLVVLAWVIAGIYAFDLLLGLTTMVLQYARGFMVGVGITDMLHNVVYLFERPVHGVLYFGLLLALSHGLLIALDMEDNTRREARD